jgi:hypothetical protein
LLCHLLQPPKERIRVRDAIDVIDSASRLRRSRAVRRDRHALARTCADNIWLLTARPRQDEISTSRMGLERHVLQRSEGCIRNGAISRPTETGDAHHSSALIARALALRGSNLSIERFLLHLVADMLDEHRRMPRWQSSHRPHSSQSPIGLVAPQYHCPRQPGPC